MRGLPSRHVPASDCYQHRTRVHAVLYAILPGYRRSHYVRSGVAFAVPNRLGPALQSHDPSTVLAQAWLRGGMNGIVDAGMEGNEAAAEWGIGRVTMAPAASVVISPCHAMLGIAVADLLSCVGSSVRRWCFVSGVVSSGARSTGALPLLLSRGAACFGAASVHYLASRTPPAAATLKEQTSHRPGAGILDTAPHADTC
jgi:hypothetical protein